MTTGVFNTLPCECVSYWGLGDVSIGYPQVTGMSLTRYAPLRRSPACIATPAAPRLACVKPAASVHPEPGSNSSLYIHYIILSPTLTASFSQLKRINALDFSFLNNCSRYLLVLFLNLVNDLLYCLFSKAGAKVVSFPEPANFFRKKFSTGPVHEIIGLTGQRRL